VAEQGLGLVYESGHWQVHLGRRELLAQGVPVPIGARAFEIVEVLVKSANELVTKDDLMDRVWPGAAVGENTLQVHISAIRKALGRDRAMLKTASGRGYRLLGDWTARRHDASAPPIGLQRIRLTGESPGTNLPVTVSRLIGRSAAVRQLQDLISAWRILSLTGPGGIGKTSLALKVARRVLGEFADGGWLVELASLSDPALVPSTVAQVLRLGLSGVNITAESVAHAVGGKQLLLVLDNCEHVIDAAANLAEMLVRLCPRVTILATSREVLRVQGELVYRVPPLEVPAEDHVDADEILGHSAPELFLARTSEWNSEFASDARSVKAIAAICRHLDGMPLAIEFAAARAVTLGIEQVAAGLGDRFALLTSGRRTAVPRHRTLRATLDWSYDLLPESERRLLRRVAVFAGGFGLEAAAAVDADRTAAQVVGDIANLVAKSLIMLDTSGSQSRWKLLETIRDYALRKLAESGESDDAQRRHAAFFRDRFAPPEPGLSVPLSRQDLIRNGREIDNVRAALDWSFSSAGDKTIGVELTAAYVPVWLTLVLTSECHECCERALVGLAANTAGHARLYMQLRIGVGRAIASMGGAVEPTLVVLTEALETAGSLNDLDAQARALWALTTLNIIRGEYRAVRSAAEQLKELADQTGDPAVAFLADRFMGDALLAAGRAGEGRLCYERALRSPAIPDDRPVSVWFDLGDRATTRAQLARTLWVGGLLDQALDQAKSGLEEIPNANQLISYCRVLYFGLCRVALMRGDLEQADWTIAHLLDAATRANAPFWKTYARLLQGKLLVERGEFANAAVALEGAFETCRRTGWSASHPEFKGALALALAGLQRLDDACAAIDNAIIDAGQREDGQEWYIPELLRIKGAVLLQRDPNRNLTEAEDCFDQATRMARQQGALFWELRVALSLARLRVAQSRGAEARGILKSVYDRFTEGFEAADLRTARAMLDALPS